METGHFGIKFSHREMLPFRVKKILINLYLSSEMLFQVLWIRRLALKFGWNWGVILLAPNRFGLISENGITFNYSFTCMFKDDWKNSTGNQINSCVENFFKQGMSAVLFCQTLGILCGWSAHRVFKSWLYKEFEYFQVWMAYLAWTTPV